MDQLELFNWVEGCFWIIAAIVFAIATTRRMQPFAYGGRWIRLALIVLLLLFGLSDFVETRTGAWWRPWWLLGWKGICLFGLLTLSILYFRKKST